MGRRNKRVLYVISFLYLAYIFIPLTAAGEYTFKTSVQGKYSLDNYRSVFLENDFFYYVLRSFWLSALRDRKSTRLNSSHTEQSRMPSSA